MTEDLHIRHADGQSYDLTLADLELDASATDAEIKERAAIRLDKDASYFSGMVIDRRPNGQIMVHPEAVYG